MRARVRCVRDRAPWQAIFRGRMLQTTVMSVLAFASTNLLFMTVTSYMPHILVERGYAVAASFAFTALIQSAPIPGKIINGWLGEKLGRKLTIAGFMVLAAVGLLLFGSVTNPDTVRLYGFAMMFFGGGVFASLKIYWSEQYPTSLRGTGSGFVESCARFIGSVVSLAIMPVAMEKFGVNPPLVGVAIFLLVAALVLLIVGKETKGKLLETVTEDAVQP